MRFIVCNQGHPTTVFCKISVRRSKYYLEFSFAWARLKISSWNFHLCTTFEVFLRNSLRLSEVTIFIFYYPGYTFFLEKGNLKFSDSQMWWREESEKFSLSQNVELHLKFWRKNNTEALVIWKRTNFLLGWPNIQKILYRRLECITLKYSE